MSQDLVPVSPRRVALEEQHADVRRVALERLNAEAETAELTRAHEIMQQTAALKEILWRTRQSFEDTRLAGKASVLAGRRLGSLLGDVPNSAENPTRISPRGLLYRELGISYRTATPLVQLGRAPDPDFQRYIQRADIIPTVHGALVACQMRTRRPTKGTPQQRRRRRADLRDQPNPSIDAAYSAIRLALSHIDPLIGRGRVGARGVALRVALDALYDAEDALKPYQAGY